MTSDASKWETLKAEYLRQVEQAVSSVKHPRRHEVLEDVRSHLDQRFADLEPDRRTPENMKNILEEMGPASDYAELLDTEPVPFRPEQSRKNNFNIGLIYGVLFLVSLFLAFGTAYNFKDFELWFYSLFLPFLGPVLIMKGIVFGGFKFYRKWKFPFWKIFLAASVGTFLLVFAFLPLDMLFRRNFPLSTTKFHLTTFAKRYLYWIGSIP